jgi:molecular chaperone DnaJ
MAGGPSGDLYVVISVAEHPLFARQGKDIVCELPVSFTQLALGAEIEVPTLEEKAKLKIPAGTPTGAVFRLKGKGIADLQGYAPGDELVRVHVDVPRKLSVRQRELLEEYARNGGEEVTPVNKGFLDRVREMFG